MGRDRFMCSGDAQSW